MGLWRAIRETFKDLRACTGEVLWNRVERRVDIGIDRALDKLIDGQDQRFIGPGMH